MSTKAARLVTKWRKGKRVSMRDAARLLGISHAYVYKVEKSMRVPATEKAQKLAKIIGCEWSELADVKGLLPRNGKAVKA